ncbi:Hypothetical protein GSB_152427 [Giardia duodenalis]|uniref:Uncharacterized protein n=2 Tax=Giardia intestinalis TaxID=5741 RepID=V6TQD5_GIAIN|nr:Hypothetical protein GSB_152427 [Giardia intestinalis]
MTETQIPPAMGWCTLYAASLKPRGSSVETCLIVLAHNCYSRLEYTFRIPDIRNGQHLPSTLQKDLCLLIKTAIEWATSLMSDNHRLATMGIGNTYYFNSLAMVFHAHLDKRVESFLGEIALKYGWGIQSLSTQQTFNQKIQHANQVVAPGDLCPLCSNQLGHLQYDNLDRLVNGDPPRRRTNAVLNDETLCEVELKRIWRAITTGDTLAFRPVFQDPPGMSFCAKTLTELIIENTETQFCGWDPYDSALCSLLSMLQEYHRNALYFLYQAKTLFPDNLFGTILESMSCDLQSLIRHLPSPELRYTSAKYLEEDIISNLYMLLQSQSLRTIIYECAGSFVRLLPVYFDHENIDITQMDFQDRGRIYEGAFDLPLDPDNFLLAINPEGYLASVPAVSLDHIANRFINQSAPDSVVSSPYFNICYGTRFLTLLNCLTMLLHAKLSLTQMLMNSYESMRILRSCADKDPSIVESVVMAKIPLPILTRELLVRSLRSNSFIQNIINDILFLKEDILRLVEDERCKIVKLIEKELEGSTENSTSDSSASGLLCDPQEGNDSEEISPTSTDAANAIDVRLHLVESIDLHSGTDENSCIEDDVPIDETLFRATMSPPSSPPPSSSIDDSTDSSTESLTLSIEVNSLSLDIPLPLTQGYQIRHKTIRSKIAQVIRGSIHKKNIMRENLLDRPRNAQIIRPPNNTASTACPRIQLGAIKMIERIINEVFA